MKCGMENNITKGLKRSLHFAVVFGICTFFMSSCTNGNKRDIVNTNIDSDTLPVMADENYLQLVNELIKSYENVFDTVRVEARFAGEQQTVNAFLHDSTHMIILGRNLEAAEVEAATKAQGLTPQQNTIAYEAIAVVCGRTSADSIFDLDAFRQQRQGTVNKYTGKDFIFEQAGGSALTYLFLKTGLPKDATQNMFAIDSLQKFTDYLAANDNSIGFLSYAQISDQDDPAVRELLNTIKLLPVVHTDTSGKRMVVQLSQSSIATGEYPFVRPIVIIAGNFSQRIGTAFVNFLYKSKSARIFLKAGLVPYQIPEREFLIKDEEL